MAQAVDIPSASAVLLGRVLLLSPEPDDLRDVEAVLRTMGCQCQWRSLADGLGAAESAPTWDLVVIDGSRDERGSLTACRHLHEQRQDTFLPIIYVTSDPAPSIKVGSIEMGADAHLTRPLDRVDLMARVKSLFRLKALQDRLAEQNRQIAHINRQLRLAQKRIDEELRLAQRLQQGFLPRELPRVGRLSFAVKYMLRGRVGGDFYDVFRLDERHVGFYIADAIGHGVPAALLTVFVKKGIQTKRISGNSYRLIPPGEVLAALNADLMAHEMSENPFITMVYGIVNVQTLELTFARAGHPYPIRLSRDRSVLTLPAEGPLLGVFEASFDNRTVQLQPGDKLLLHTDGIDGVTYKDLPAGAESFLTCLADLAHLPAEAFVAELHGQLFGRDGDLHSAPDDVTFLCLDTEG